MHNLMIKTLVLSQKLLTEKGKKRSLAKNKEKLYSCLSVIRLIKAIVIASGS